MPLQVTDRCKFYFGTEQFMQWFPTPLSGAESTPEDWLASGALLNGGGYSFHSNQSHRVYQYSWRNSSTRQTAQMMKSYRDGVYGKGLIYFLDPLIYDTNVLPASLAFPGSTEGTSAGLVRNATTTLVPAGSPGVNDYPVNALRMSVPAGPIVSREVFIPIPPGYALHLGGVYSGSGMRPVYQILDLNGNRSSQTLPVMNMPADEPFVAPHSGIVGKGVYLFFDRINPGTAGYLELRAMTGRLIKVNEPPAARRSGPWVGGQGHSGCRFDGPPTYIEYNGVGGGQVGFAATFREVGMWTPYAMDGGFR